MGLYLLVGLKEAAPLASNTGWSDVLDWATDLPEGEFMVLRHLCQYGWTGRAEELRRDVREALDMEPPGKGDVRDTVENLLESLSDLDGVEVVTVTNGMGPDDGPGEDEEDRGSPVDLERLWGAEMRDEYRQIWGNREPCCPANGNGRH